MDDPEMAPSPAATGGGQNKEFRGQAKYNAICTAALSLADAGISVFPCRPDKSPRTSRGFHDASTDPATIKEWWDRWPSALIGVPTGPATDLLVIDIDPDGTDWYAEHAADLPAGRIHKTQRGHHLLFRHAEGIKCSAGKAAPGVDVRADGGYIVWWPAHGMEAVGDLDEIGDAPAWLLEKLRDQKQHQTPVQPADGVIPEGRRNESLTSIAGTLRRRGLDADAINAALSGVNTAQCRPPLPDIDIRRIAESVSQYPAQNAEHTADDAPPALARRVITSQAGILRWQGQFWSWREGSYHPLSDDAVSALVYRELDYKVSRRTCGEVIDAMRAMTYIVEATQPPVFLPSGTPLPAGEIPLRNGILNLADGTAQPTTPDLFALSALPVDFDPDADCPQWQAFLAELWPDDAEARETLQELFGYLISGRTDHQKVFLLIGPRRAGKGTILRILARLLGTDNIAAPTLASMATPFGLQTLIGKLAALVSDARLSGRADQEAIAERLLSISGEDHISIPRKFLADYTARIGARFVLATNELPRLHDASGALASRFIPLVLSNSWFGREERGLSDRLAAEIPGILNWARVGYIRLEARGYFRIPQSSRDAVQEMADLGSPVSAFIRDYCHVGPGLEVPCSELYTAWQAWCEEHGRKHPGTEQMFGRDLKAAVPGVTTHQVRRDGDRVRVYVGLSRDVTRAKPLHAMQGYTCNTYNGPPRVTLRDTCPACDGEGCRHCEVTQ